MVFFSLICFFVEVRSIIICTLAKKEAHCSLLLDCMKLAALSKEAPLSLTLNS